MQLVKRRLDRLPGGRTALSREPGPGETLGVLHFQHQQMLQPRRAQSGRFSPSPSLSLYPMKGASKLPTHVDIAQRTRIWP